MRVGLGPDGAVRTIAVDQTLTINGTGDFELKVLGPITDVDAPPEQSPQPGLRRTTVLWSGFSAGTKVIRSTLTLDAVAESVRLPIAVVAVGGTTTLRNQTTLPATIDVGPADVRALVAAVRARPDPLDGLPATIPATGPVTQERINVTVPVRVTGTVGATPVDVTVGEQPHTIPATGDVRLRVTGAFPTIDAHAGVRELQAALTAAARKADVDVFIGVTAPGPSTTVYEYGPAAAPPPGPPPPEKPKRSPLAVAITAIGALAIAIAGRALWLRS